MVSVVLENYGGSIKSGNPEGSGSRWVQEVKKNEGHVSPSPETLTRVPSWRAIVNDKGEVNVTS